MHKIHEFEMPMLPPSVNAMYHRTQHGGVMKSPKVEEFEKVAMMYVPQRRDPITDPCKLTLVFTFERPANLKRRDVDNMLKVTIDLLSSFRFVEDDNLIYEITATKKAGDADSITGFFEIL
jgi:Holliday junction resolvase RusA-like endonuclease